MSNTDAFAKHLARLHTPGTYRNTKFPTWWKRLNDELLKRGLPEYTFGPAHDAYEMGLTPAMEAHEAAIRAEYTA